MSLFPDYLKERMGWEILERTEGFVCWSVSGDYLRVEEVYVVPEQRGRGFAADLVRYVEEIARQKELKGLWTQVWARGPGCSDTLAKAIKVGFKVTGTENGAIIMTKEFGG